MNVTIYSTPTCPYCIQAKEYFKSKKIPFQNYDVSRDKEKAQEMIDISGQMGVPVIKIDDNTLPTGRQVIVGFDKEEIEKSIKKP